VELPAGEGGFKETSMAKCEQIGTIKKTARNQNHIAGNILLLKKVLQDDILFIIQ
jgi:mRNA-degrading endonuclease toxin of MazEF toxin-antitoxin module